MSIETVVTFQPDETVWILTYIYDQRTGIAPAVDPTTITVTISGPDGVAVITNQAMDKHADGEYEYFYTLLADAPKGWWRGLVKIVDGSGELAKSTIGTFGFRVK